MRCVVLPTEICIVGIGIVKIRIKSHQTVFSIDRYPIRHYYTGASPVDRAEYQTALSLIEAQGAQHEKRTSGDIPGTL